MPMLRTFCSIDEILRYRAANTPDAIAYTFLLGSAQVERTVSYADLDRQARTIAAALQNRSLHRARALLMFDPGPSFAAAFFGCLYAGVVAVPLYPPHRNRGIERVHAVARNCDPAIVLVDHNILARSALCRDALPALQKVQWLDIENIEADGHTSWRDPNHAADHIAILQYTSGSTATPKGVMLTHANILHNQERIRDAFEHTADSVVVGWLPFFHDMGLIGNLLQPLYVGCSCILMPPMHFLQRPIRWLEAISHYHATTSGGPNFAYDLCVDAITKEERKELDLSSWGLAFNGAERVRVETLERFTEAFEPAGFRAAAFYPCYGLAEGTLIVSGGRKADPVRMTSQSEHSDDEVETCFVSCGEPLPGHQIRIVDPDLCAPLPEGMVGEIWIAGGNVAPGYWKRTPTDQDFAARLPADGHAYFRTGDLGFVKEKELFVTGRVKDLIILRGRNFYPEDLEFTVTGSNVHFRPYGCAVVAVEKDGRENICVLVEVSGKEQHDFEELRCAIDRSLAFEHDIVPDFVLFLKPQSIPKTSSGKIQRHLCRTMAKDANLPILCSC